ncbi:MAG: RagB/SusD family nutrient uptake outer membrane protein [Marinifilum sp.]|jgi:tetratricopeptide (TPR) repeat protein|nr:RagB/SusD family nutrient uptake outer membrane protein [Marinifilum sp.]
MRKLIDICALFLLTILFSACDNYLDIVPKGFVIPTKTEEYNLLLNKTRLARSFDKSLIFLNDELYLDDATFKGMEVDEKNAYTWAPIIYEASMDDKTWNTCYSKIYNYNVIINEVEASSEGTEQQKKELKAEALTGRAYEFFNVLQLYAKPYNASSADTDMGIALILQPDINAKPSRISVKDSYGRIISDIKEALINLPEESVNNSRFGKVSAWALLSKVYFAKRDYTNALEYANKVLEKNSYLLDLNDYSKLSNGSNDIPGPIKSKETILLRYYNATFAANRTGYVNTELVNAYGGNDDLRFYFHFDQQASGNYQFFYGFNGDFISVGIDVPDMMLVKAESQARTKDVPGAMTTLNALLAKRFKTETYTALTATTEAEAVNLIVNERWKEFPFSMKRWFDLHRLSGDSKYSKNLSRTVEGETFTLKTGDNRWALAIPNPVINLNENIKQNPR